MNDFKMTRYFTRSLCAIWLLLLPSLGNSKVLGPGEHPLTVELSLTPNQVGRGLESQLRLDLAIQKGFFVYEDKIKVSLLEPEETAQSDLRISPIIEFDDVVTKKVKRGLKESGQVLTNIVFPRSLNLSLREIIVSLEYVACTSEYCLLPKVIEARLPANIVKNDDMDSAVDEGAALSLKDSLGTEIGFNLLVTNHFFFALLLIFAFGVLTSFTPCIYPLIPITMMVLGANSERSFSFRLSRSLLYVFGIALTYSALGVFAALSGGLFGSFAGHPVVLLAMSLIFLLMGLSLFGLFEIKTPAVLEATFKKYEKTSGPLGTFISGCLSGIVAGPCVGPVLVGILAYIAHQRDPVLGFLFLFLFALGFGSLFVLLGTFVNFQKKLPRSGPWMVTVKFFLGFIMVGMAFWYARPLLKKWVTSGPVTSVSQGPDWQKYSDELINKAQQEGRPVLIDFYADWCLACVEMDKFTFSEKSVQEALKAFTLIKVDATEPYPELRELQSKYKVFGLPSYIFITPDGKIIEDEMLTGFEESAQFLERLKRFQKHSQ